MTASVRGLLIVGISLLLALSAIRTAETKPAPASKIAANCATSRPMIAVRSSVDTKLYQIDVCAVADSAEGTDFRVEIK